LVKFIHVEIPANNLDRAIKFYTQVFDWKVERMTLNGIDHFFIISKEHEDESFGHITQRDTSVDSILNYIGVTSIEEYTKKIEENGGITVVNKTPVDNLGFYSLCKDSEGNLFGLWEEKKKKE
jgi:predicted enzyme related to lactoylglutathione lyase